MRVYRKKKCFGDVAGTWWVPLLLLEKKIYIYKFFKIKKKEIKKEKGSIYSMAHNLHASGKKGKIIETPVRPWPPSLLV